MRNFRSLVLGLVLVSLSPLGWGETWRCEPTMYDGNWNSMRQRVVTFWLDDHDPMLQIEFNKAVSFDLDIRRNSSVVALGKFIGSNTSGIQGGSFKLDKKQGSLEMQMQTSRGRYHFEGSVGSCS